MDILLVNSAEEASFIVFNNSLCGCLRQEVVTMNDVRPSAHEGHVWAKSMVCNDEQRILRGTADDVRRIKGKEYKLVDIRKPFAQRLGYPDSTEE